MTLAVQNRPLYITELADLLGAWHSKIDQALVPLEQVGIVSSTFSRNNLRWVALNRGFPAYREALRLLRRLEAVWPQLRVGKPRRTAERLALGTLRRAPGRRASLSPSDRLVAADVDLLFYSKPGTRVLLSIAAMGQTDVVDLHKTLGVDRRSVWNVANRWQREGVIRSVRSGRRRVLELEPAFVAAPELRRFLGRLVAVTEEYEGLAGLSTRNPSGTRFTTLR